MSDINKKDFNFSVSTDLDVDTDSGYFKKWFSLFFVLSGMTGLIYEVSWLNQIQLIMGHTVYSLATVLSSYLSGLALGAYWISKRPVQNSLRFYVVMEFIIGIYGVLFPYLLKWGRQPILNIFGSFHLSLPMMSLVQFFICGALILLPTACMGSTLPLLFDGFSKFSPGAAKTILPRLYRLNTAGALLGCLLASFLLLPSLGYFSTMILAAGMNLVLVSLYGFFVEPRLSRWSVQLNNNNEDVSFVHDSKQWSSEDRTMLVLLFFSGFLSMLAQILWNRLLAMALGPSVYIFPITTFCVLIGIFFGAWLVQYRLPSIRSLNLFPAILGLSLLFVSGCLSRFSWWTFYFFSFFEPTPTKYFTLSLLASIILTLPASVGIGALFPAATNHLGGSKARVGQALVANLSGLLLGALLSCFLFIPFFGLEKTLFLVATVSVGLSTYLYWNQESWIFRVSFLSLSLILLAGRPHFDRIAMTSGYFYNRFFKKTSQELSLIGYTHLIDLSRHRESKLLDYQDDPHATYSVHESYINGTDRAFKVNGKVDGNNTSDLQTTRFVALLPLLVKSEIPRVLTIGLGTGSTVVETLMYPGLQMSRVVELSPAMIQFSKKNFSEISAPLFKDPRVSMINQDGRVFLEQNRDRYDLIISEPSNPWVDGVASLFTVEYYQSIAKHLNPDGVASLWFHSYGLDCVAVQSVFKSMAQVFTDIHVFRVGGDLYVLASLHSLFMRPLFDNSLKKRLFSVVHQENRSYDAFFEQNYLFGRTGLSVYTYNSPMNTDDHQVLQYRSGKTYFTGISCQDFESYRSVSEAQGSFFPGSSISR